MYRRKLAMWLPLAVAIGTIVFFQWQGAQRQNSENSLETEQSAEVVQEEADELVKQLSEIAVLPEGEVPTLVRVRDKEDITENKEFFEDAENGDVVLVYSQARKAFLFRPSENKLINLAPVNISDVSAPLPISVPVEDTNTVVLLNSTDTPDLTRQFELKLKAAFDSIEVVDRANAAETNYDTSIVVAIAPEAAGLAEEIANSLQLNLGRLPPGEDLPEADLLIILGRDQME